MKRYIRASGDEMINNLLSLTQGMWFEPMDKFSQVIYNADEIIPLIDFDQCVEFGTQNGQELLIYDMHGDRKHIRYSCSMTTMFDEIVLTDVWDKNGQVYVCDYDAIWDELAEKNNWNGEVDYDVEASTIGSTRVKNKIITSRTGRGKYPVVTIPVSQYERLGLENYPNFSASGSVSGMRKRYWGDEALLVRCGAYIYNVTANPDIYWSYANR